MTTWFKKLKARLIAYLSTEGRKYVTTESGKLILVIDRGQYASLHKSVTSFNNKNKAVTLFTNKNKI